MDIEQYSFMLHESERLYKAMCNCSISIATSSHKDGVDSLKAENARLQAMLSMNSSSLVTTSISSNDCGAGYGEIEF